MGERAGARFGLWLIGLCSVLGCSPQGGEPGSDEADEAPVGVAAQALLMTVEQAKLVPSTPVADGAFGLSVALQGDTAVAGMHLSDPFNSGIGAAYVFGRTGPTWSEVAVLKAPDVPKYDNFGATVALDGDTIAAGAAYLIDDDSPAVFTFVRSGATWLPEATLVPEDGLGSQYFGASIGLAGDTLVALDQDSGDGGAVYVFTRQGGAWSQQARVVPGEAAEQLGRAVALSGETMIVSGNQKTFVYVRTGAVWSEQAQLATDSAYSVALDGDTAVVGSPAIERCQVFSRMGGAWSMAAELSAPQQVGYDFFGAAVALEDDRLLVGASVLYAPSAIGFAYTFRREAGAWAAESVIQPDGFYYESGAVGAAVALSGDTLLLGAPDDKALKAHGGAAHVLLLAPGLEAGAPCDEASACASGFCADGVCCDTLCADTCMACSAAKTGSGVSGACAPIAAGSDPDAECVVQAAVVCGNDGFCNGNGACQKLSSATSCDDGDPCTDGDACGNGACAGKPRSCAPPDGCHLPGLCNQQTGECEYALKNPDAADCNDAAAPAGCGCTVPGAIPSSQGWWLLAVGALSALLRTRSGPSSKSGEAGPRERGGPS